ncbi:hypothetical protein E8E13_007819 [Curvularia kusanoi]|uniref:Uncharacterized protein n=1 Tax=Curvularia kusanoi TaxID=90978 RepID=A0A9P4W8K7_CURKU|nr:hypothetical protein E8E13_007819 [Curvularia kusanoi]
MSAYGLPLGRLYGPFWLTPSLWSPHFKSVWTAEKDASNHHCPDPECQSDIRTRCYNRLHVAFCLCIVTMPNGHHRFCGHRFQAESPRACALHGWGEGDENRVFQRAKKGLEFELPKVFPHEQSGWEMVVSGLGIVQQPVSVRMGLVDGEFCFVRVISYRDDEQPDRVSEIARVKTKELLITATDPRVGFRTGNAAGKEDAAETAVQALKKSEQHGLEFKSVYEYRNYTYLASQRAANEKLQEKKAKEAKSAALAAQRAGAAKGGKSCAQESRKSYKQFTKRKKKNAQTG